MIDNKTTISLPNIYWQNTQNKKIIPLMINLLWYEKNDMEVTVDKIIQDCGFTPQKGKGRTTEQFRNLLKELQDEGVILSDVDFLKIRLKTGIQIKLKRLINDPKSDYYVMVDYNQFNELMINKGRPDEKINILIVLFNITREINMRKKQSYFWCSIEGLVRLTGMDDKTINKCIKKLKDLKILHYDNIGNINKIVDGKNQTKVAINVYALTSENLDKGLKASEAKYKEEGCYLPSAKNALNKAMDKWDNKEEAVEVILEGFDEKALNQPPKVEEVIMSPQEIEYMEWLDQINETAQPRVTHDISNFLDD